MSEKNFEYIGGSLYRFHLETSEHTQMIDMTGRIQEIVEFSGVSSGLCTVFIPHTTAAVTVNENADPDVQSDLKKGLGEIVPWDKDYLHIEGNAAAHIKSSMIGTSEMLIVRNRRLLLGQWQGVYFMEFDGSRSRTVYVKLMQDGSR